MSFFCRKREYLKKGFVELDRKVLAYPVLYARSSIASAMYRASAPVGDYGDTCQESFPRHHRYRTSMGGQGAATRTPSQ